MSLTKQDLLSVELDLRRLIRDELQKLGLIEQRTDPVAIKPGPLVPGDLERMHYRPVKVK